MDTASSEWSGVVWKRLGSWGARRASRGSAQASREGFLEERVLAPSCPVLPLLTALGGSHIPPWVKAQVFPRGPQGPG